MSHTVGVSPPCFPDEASNDGIFFTIRSLLLRDSLTSCLPAWPLKRKEEKIWNAGPLSKFSLALVTLWNVFSLITSPSCPASAFAAAYYHYESLFIPINVSFGVHLTGGHCGSWYRNVCGHWRLFVYSPQEMTPGRPIHCSAMRLKIMHFDPAAGSVDIFWGPCLVQWDFLQSLILIRNHVLGCFCFAKSFKKCNMRDQKRWSRCKVHGE